MEPSLIAENISKKFGKYSIINELSLQIDKETVYGLVGLNGAGKTTLLRLLLGILKPDKGSISVLGVNPWEHREQMYKKFGVVLDNDGFWGNLTIMENLAIYGAAKGVTKKDLETYFDEFWSGTPLFKNDKKVKYLSRGQKMQCGLCRAFLGWPSIFFLDEPALALDMTAYEHLCTMVREARCRGAIVIISSHQLDTIDTLCDRVGILRDNVLMDLPKSNGGNRWVIVTGDTDRSGEILKVNGCSEIVFDHGWHFTIENPETGIPHVVKELVLCGSSVLEVRKESAESSFGETIRNLYLNPPVP
ncbi:MAG: ABC transporter ATP-binding protein [Fibrobacter sp.]|nr:ABC transporter ATP-binding protein [Fibrobacter sp.]